jgi:hypothetical protein
LRSRLGGRAAGPSLESDAPTGDKVDAFLARALEATGSAPRRIQIRLTGSGGR